MPPRKRSASAATKRPERKIGPFQHGIAVNIWLNEIEGPDGEIRFFRSVTLSPRRYREDGVWRDASSFRPIDLSVLVLALEEARRFIAATPLPGQPVEGDEMEEMTPDNESDTAE